MTTQKTNNKTTYTDVQNALADMSAYVTTQNNEVNQYCRVCFTDDFKKDSYKIMKDFAVYYDRKDSFKISIADSTLTDCKVFKENHERTEKTKELAFSVKSEKLRDTLLEIIAQRVLQSSKAIAVTEKKKASASKRRAKKAQ